MVAALLTSIVMASIKSYGPVIRDHNTRTKKLHTDTRTTNQWGVAFHFDYMMWRSNMPIAFGLCFYNRERLLILLYNFVRNLEEATSHCPIVSVSLWI